MGIPSLRVLIVGGGLGGLCLAQGLLQAGIQVEVYERDPTTTFRRQGYRLHIDSRGVTGLRTCLPSHLFELFMATTSHPGHQVTVINKRLKKLKVIDFSETNKSVSATFNTAADRLTLREILLAGLDHVVHFNKEFSHYEPQVDGSVRAYFIDGTDARGDVLVAADGVNSRIRRQFLPGASVVDANVRCIYGKTLLADVTRSLIPDYLYHGFTMAAGSRFNLALGLVEFLHPPAETAVQFVPDIQLHNSGSYLMWCLNARRERFAVSDDELFQMDGTALRKFVLKKIESWHPHLRTLVGASDPAEIFPIAVRVSERCEPWQSTSITLLGDAIHAMSPAGGSGANMALLDAHLLCQTLISVADGEQPLVPALHEYEARMLKDGFEAVRFSANGGVLTDTTPKKSLFQAVFNAARFSRQAR